MGGSLEIRRATPPDAVAIAAIYGWYVDNSVATFETHAPDCAAMLARITHIMPHYPFVVAERDGQLLGYAYAGRLYERAAYRWTVENTVYVAPEGHRQGVARMLYRTLLDALAQQGFVSAIGKITLPNPASIALHERFGFVRRGVLEQVGFKHGAWHDVGLYQLDLCQRAAAPEEPRPSPG